MSESFVRVISLGAGSDSNRLNVLVSSTNEKSFTVAVSNVLARCVADVLSSSLPVATSQLCFVSLRMKESAEHPLLRPTGAGFSSRWLT